MGEWVLVLVILSGCTGVLLEVIIDEQEMTFDLEVQGEDSQKGLSRACHQSQRGINARSKVLKPERNP